MNDINILALHEHGSASPSEVRALCLELGQLRYRFANIRSILKGWEDAATVADNKLRLITELALDPSWKANPKYIMINDLLDILSGPKPTEAQAQILARVTIPADTPAGTVVHMGSGTLTCPRCAESYRVDERHLCFDDVRRIENDHG